MLRTNNRSNAGITAARLLCGLKPSTIVAGALVISVALGSLIFGARSGTGLGDPVSLARTATTTGASAASGNGNQFGSSSSNNNNNNNSSNTGNGTTTAATVAEYLHGLSRILFGDLWGRGEYCGGPRRSVEQILRDDDDIRALSNGSKLHSLWQDEQLSPDERLMALQQAQAKLRSQVPILCSQNSWGYVDEDTFELANQPYDSSSECSRELERMLETGALLDENVRLAISRACDVSASNKRHCQNTTDPRLTPAALGHWLMLSSFARPPVGALYKTSVWLGDYNACVTNALGRYCYVAYQIGGPKGDKLAENTVPMRHHLRVGVCLPRQCNSRTVLRQGFGAKLDTLVKLNWPRNLHNAPYKLADVHCPPVHDSPLRRFIIAPHGDRFNHVGALNRTLLLLGAVWLFLLLYVNLICFVRSRQDSWSSSRMNLVGESFKLHKNWRAFLDNRHPAPELIGLNGIKTLAMGWLMCTHVLYASLANIENLNEMHDQWVKQRSFLGALIFQGQHAVPAFFVISGILAGHKHLRPSPHRTAHFSYFKFIAQRYLRLAPMYLLVYAYIKQFGHLLGDGPLWDYGVSPESEARQCHNESWLVPLLMLADFIPPFVHCVLTGWHIANDFHIYLVLPILFVAHRKSPKLAKWLAIALVLVSNVFLLVSYHLEPTYSSTNVTKEALIFGSRYIADRLAHAYVSPLGRLGAYSYGVMVAFWLAAVKARRGARDNKGLAGCDTGACLQQPPGPRDKGDTSAAGACLELAAASRGKRSYKFQLDDDAGRQVTAASGTRRALVGLSLFVWSFAAFGFAFFATLMKGTITFGTTHSSLGRLSAAYPALCGLVDLAWYLLLLGLLRNGLIQLRDSGDGSNGRGFDQDQTNVDNSSSNSSSNNNNNNGHGNAQLQTQVQAVSERASWIAVVVHFLDRKLVPTLCGPLRARVWNVLVKLNYCLILVHFTVARYVIQSQRQWLVYSWLNGFQLCACVIALSYLLSLLLHLLVEAPLSALIKGTLLARLETKI